MTEQFEYHSVESSGMQATSRREALLREIRAAEARLGRLVLEAGIGLPSSQHAYHHPSDADRMAAVLARKIQDLRRQISTA